MENRFGADFNSVKKHANSDQKFNLCNLWSGHHCLTNPDQTPVLCERHSKLR